MKLAFKAGTTSKDINIFIQDSSVATGAGLTGLAYNSGSLTAYYHRQGASSATAITLATKTVGTWATGGFVAVDGTNMPGLYELGIPDAALASGATWVIIMLKGATNMAPVVLEIELLATDNQDAVRMGLTALPNASAAANGGLPTVDANNAVKLQSGTGANQISLSSGLVTLAGVTHTGAVIPTVTTTTTATNVTTVNGLASGVITATSIAADAITAAKIADGAIDAATFAAGAINAAAIATDAITAAKIAADAIGASELAADAVAEIQSGLATPTNITAGTITTVTNLTNAPTNGDFTATMKTSITTAATAATPSVTVSDKTGFSLSSAGVQAIWDKLTSALTTSGSIGKLIVDYLNASISGIADLIGTPTNADLATDIAAIQSDTNDIQTRLPAGLNSGNITAHVVSIANNAITAASIATNAIDADALAADAVTEIGTGISVSAPTVDDIDTKLTAMHGSGNWTTATGFATPTDVDDSTAAVVASIGALNNLSATQVWAAGTRTLTSGGAPTTTEIWTAATRTLTSPTPGSTTPPAISGTTLSITRAVSFDVTVTGMTIPANWDKIYFTVKGNSTQADNVAQVQIVITNGGDAGDGLLYANGEAAGDATQAELTVDQPGGDITVTITDDQTEELTAGTYSYDFKVITDESKSTILAAGVVSITTPITLAVS